MILYKYMPFRIEFLENLLLRATGKESLNDPFEFEPSVEFVSDLLMKTGNSILGTTKSEIENRHSDIVSYPVAKATGWNIKKSFGVICFSETHDNLLMWAHYAENHTGFVVGIDSEHEFFKTKYADERIDYAGKVHRVLYRKRRVEDSDRFAELFLTKSDEWMYEKEHRFLVQLRRCDKCLVLKTKFDSTPIYTRALMMLPRASSYNDRFYSLEVQSEDGALFSAENSMVHAMFEIPKSAIVSIGFGAKLQIQDRREATELIRKSFVNNPPKILQYKRDKYRYEVFSEEIVPETVT